MAIFHKEDPKGLEDMPSTAGGCGRRCRVQPRNQRRIRSGDDSGQAESEGPVGGIISCLSWPSSFRLLYAGGEQS
eukprot:9322030-Pyramimonas_sp.AAC.1